jgi:hypothetical protein
MARVVLDELTAAVEAGLPVSKQELQWAEKRVKDLTGGI